MNKVLIAGSREWHYQQPIEAELRMAYHDLGGQPLIVMHGGARGADRIGGAVARFLGFKEEVYPPDWNSHGKRAGFLRNRQMVEQVPDLVLAFQVNGSKGTQHTIDLAVAAGIPVRLTRIERIVYE